MKTMGGVSRAGLLDKPGEASPEAWEGLAGGLSQSGGLLPQPVKDTAPGSDETLRKLFGLDYDPGEPRLPKGEGGGGEWTATAEGTGHREKNRAFLIPTVVFNGKSCRPPPGGLASHRGAFAAMPKDSVC